VRILKLCVGRSGVMTKMEPIKKKGMAVIYVVSIVVCEMLLIEKSILSKLIVKRRNISLCGSHGRLAHC